MNVEVLRKYWVELAIATLAVVALLVGLVLTHHGQAPPDAAATGASATSDTASSNASTATTATANVKSLPLLAGGTYYYLDRVQHGSTVEHYTPGKPMIFTMAPGETLSLTGWSFDGRANAPAGGIVGEVDQATRAAGTYGMPRGDVVTVFKNPKLDKVGFVINIPPGALPPGKHAITLLVENAAQNAYYPERNVAIVTVGQ